MSAGYDLHGDIIAARRRYWREQPHAFRRLAEWCIPPAPADVVLDSHGRAWHVCSPRMRGAEAFGPRGAATPLCLDGDIGAGNWRQWSDDWDHYGPEAEDYRFGLLRGVESLAHLEEIIEAGVGGSTCAL